MEKINICKSTEITLDHFLKLPRRAQLFFFEDMHNREMNGEQVYWQYDTSGAFNTEECKSPIEQMLCFALSLIFARYDSEFYFTCQEEIYTKSGKHYFADFAIMRCDGEEEINEPFVLIECDGHDFHEKTKKQVANRNERDLNLKMEGYDILHFSGTQIYEDPFYCAKEILKYCRTKVGDENI